MTNTTKKLAKKKGVVVSEDRKSTRLNSSHMSISYAVFCLKKKISGCLPGFQHRAGVRDRSRGRHPHNDHCDGSAAHPVLHLQCGGKAMSANVKLRTEFPTSKVLWSVFGWLVALVFFFPVLWMWLESLKTEPQAASSPPTIFFAPTLEEFQLVLSGDFPPYFINSAIASILSTFLVVALGLPAAYALAIRPVKRTRDVLFFFISTRFLPFAASLVPLYLLARDLQLLDNIFALALIY